MTKFRTFLLSLAFLGFIVSSTWAQSVYVGGEFNNKATIWKNGTPTILSTRSSKIFSVVVDNGIVYAAGYEFDEVSHKLVAKLWKNNEEKYAISADLPPEQGKLTMIFSVAVSGNDVYMAGVKDGIGKMWKNGVEELGYTNAQEVRSVLIRGNKIFAAGSTISGEAVVWENGALLYTLTAGTYLTNEAHSIAIDDNGDVYTVAYEWIEIGIGDGKWLPKVFKNNAEFYTLGTIGTNSKHGLGLYISNGIIYVAGHELISGKGYVAKLWTDGVDANLVTDATQGSFALSVFVQGNDVYVTGYQFSNGKALLWKNNGVPTTLAAGINCGAYSVFVTPEDADIAEMEGKVFLQVYPNPTTGELRIDNGELIMENVEVFDISGKKLKGESKKENGEKEVLIDISELAVGVYFLRIITDQGEVVKKVLKK